METMTSVALPKLAFSRPPTVSLVWYATFSVTSPARRQDTSSNLFVSKFRVA